jgi:hypothetical protein
MKGDVGGGADMPDAGLACATGWKAMTSRIAKANAPPIAQTWPLRQRIIPIVG